jgi:hypothetical protein
MDRHRDRPEIPEDVRRSELGQIPRIEPVGAVLLRELVRYLVRIHITRDKTLGGSYRHLILDELAFDHSDFHSGIIRDDYAPADERNVRHATLHDIGLVPKQDPIVVAAADPDLLGGEVPKLIADPNQLIIALQKSDLDSTNGLLVYGEHSTQEYE